MSRAYSSDLRERVIGTVMGGASRREAAEVFGISPSAAVKWLQAWHIEGICAPKPHGGSSSELEEYSDRILTLVKEQPDLTLDELLVAMHRQGIPGSRSALWRFLDRHDITVKKKVCARRSNIARTWRGRAGAGIESKACLTQRGWCLSTRLRPAPTWSGSRGAALEVSD